MLNKDNRGGYSQYKQDLFVDKILRHKRNGSFLDIGAYDGVTISNTYLFEKFRNWNGICIEPHIDNFKKLEKNRNCILENCAITDKDGSVTFRKVFGPDTLSGVLEFMDRIDQLEDHIKREGGSYEDVIINSYNINSIFKKHNIRKIDYCSIDVEGGEWAIIKNIDFNAVEISVFSIEGDKENITSFLSEKGYLCIKSETDNFYINRNINIPFFIKEEITLYKFRCKLKRHVPAWMKKFI